MLNNLLSFFSQCDKIFLQINQESLHVYSCGGFLCMESYYGKEV